MNFKSLFIMMLLSAGVMFSANAQEVKIGYTNIELVLAYMPETKSVETQLATYQKKLSEQIVVKENYAKQRLQEILDKKEKGTLTPEMEQAAQVELGKLDEDIRKFASDSEEKLYGKRQELLVPVLEKLQKAIDDVAIEQGFSYILNQTTSTGVSTILYGPEEADMTETIMAKLGIKLPAQGGN